MVPPHPFALHKVGGALTGRWCAVRGEGAVPAAWAAREAAEFEARTAVEHFYCAYEWNPRATVRAARRSARPVHLVAWPNPPGSAVDPRHDR
jgi:hypothetical protein